MRGPTTAMVMAAGLGLRMRPLTEHKPKALIEVRGKALIDHILDRLEAAGVTRAVVNVHGFAEQMEAHLARRRSPEILISDERGALLETGGGLKHARQMLGEAPIWVANSDYVWLPDRDDALAMLAAAWDPTRMDACVIAIPKARTSGFDTPGDFFVGADGALTLRGAAAEAPYHCFGVEILDPQRVYAVAAAKFSLFQIWKAASEHGRLHGVVPDGFWMQVGDPAALAFAEARLAEAV
jgi:N-acetyl-alpha-D-muramate 1-phosphate uridylyltransferase